MNSDELLSRLGDPRLRLDSIPGMAAYRQAFELHPDRHLHELLGQVVAISEAAVPLEDDPFVGNLPPKDAVPPPALGRVPLVSMHTGVFSVLLAVLCRNLLLVGPTGGGKSNTIRAILASLLGTEATIIAFTRKSDLAESLTLNHAANPVTFLNWQDLAIAPLQVPPKADELSYFNTLADFFASSLSLEASRRMMRSQLHALRQKHVPFGFSDWIAAIEKVNTKGFWRSAQYQDASTMALRDVAHQFGRVFDCQESDLLDKLTSHRGCVSISTAGLAPEMAAVLACLTMHWAYETRTEADAGRPCLFLLDDALPQLHGSQSSESEGGVSPLATWAFMGRSRGMGIIAAAQNFSLVSPAIRNNCETIGVCGGSVGSDARDIAAHLHLSKEQTTKLTQLTPGEAVVWSRSTWPLPVYGRVPLVP